VTGLLSGPPDGELGAVVAAHLVLVRRDDLVVALTHLTAYRQGFEVCLSTRARRGLDLLDQCPPRHVPGSAGDALWFGVAFSNGRKATNLQFAPPAGTGREPPHPVLWPGGGSGSESRHDQWYWVWPLPLPGPLTFVCQWSKYGIDLTQRDLDARLILDAGANSEVLWDAPPAPRTDSSFTSTRTVGETED
jgi:hypothetical protein